MSTFSNSLIGGSRFTAPETTTRPSGFSAYSMIANPPKTTPTYPSIQGSENATEQIQKMKQVTRLKQNLNKEYYESKRLF